MVFWVGVAEAVERTGDGRGDAVGGDGEWLGVSEEGGGLRREKGSGSVSGRGDFDMICTDGYHGTEFGISAACVLR